jgi:hypothetical protein
MHLNDIRARINQALDPRPMGQLAAGADGE